MTERKGKSLTQLMGELEQKSLGEDVVLCECSFNLLDGFASEKEFQEWLDEYYPEKEIDNG